MKFKESGPFKMTYKVCEEMMVRLVLGLKQFFCENHVTVEKLVTRYREVSADQYRTVRGASTLFCPGQEGLRCVRYHLPCHVIFMKIFVLTQIGNTLQSPPLWLYNPSKVKR
jgi:hypothetical protein